MKVCVFQQSEQDGAAIVFEASGACHRDLERSFARRGLTFAKVNPRQARRFAEAIGQVAKTDKVPSRDIALQCTAGRGIIEQTSGLDYRRRHDHASWLSHLM